MSAWGNCVTRTTRDALWACSNLYWGCVEWGEEEREKKGNRGSRATPKKKRERKGVEKEWRLTSNSGECKKVIELQEDEEKVLAGKGKERRWGQWVRGEWDEDVAGRKGERWDYEKGDKCEDGEQESIISFMRFTSAIRVNGAITRK